MAMLTDLLRRFSTEVSWHALVLFIVFVVDTAFLSAVCFFFFFSFSVGIFALAWGASPRLALAWLGLACVAFTMLRVSSSYSARCITVVE